MTSNKSHLYLKCIVIIALLCTLISNGLILPVTSAAAENEGSTPTVFRTGFMQSVFADTDVRDAKIVLETHSREVARLLGLNLSASVTMFSDIGHLTEAIRKNELELAAIPSLDFLRIRKNVPLIPSFVGSNMATQGISYLIIARKDSGVSSFSDLKNKSILLPPVAFFEPSHLWLEVLLMKTGKESRDTFFHQVKESPKVSKAIMGVYFRQADAAVVTRAGFDTSCQLNPQLGTQLTVLAESPNLCDIVVCMLPSTSRKFRNDLSKSMLQLNETKTGKQMYTIFKSGGMALFKPEYLVGLEGLLRERALLIANKNKRK